MQRSEQKSTKKLKTIMLRELSEDFYWKVKARAVEERMTVPEYVVKVLSEAMGETK